MKRQIVFQTGNWIVYESLDERRPDIKWGNLMPGCECDSYLRPSLYWPIPADCVDIQCVECSKIMTRKEWHLLLAFLNLMSLPQ